MTEEVNKVLDKFSVMKGKPGFMQTIDSSAGWVWKDSYIKKDFDMLLFDHNSLKITDKIVLLKSFYLAYFGVTAHPVNLGALFSQLLASAPHFTESNTNLFTFSLKGKVPLLKYEVDSGIDGAYDRLTDLLRESTGTDINIPKPEIDAPVEREEDGLTDDNIGKLPTTFAKEQHAPLIEPAPTDITGYLSFRSNVIKALQSLEDPDDRQSAKAARSLRRLHMTAAFLILILLRRIAKRAVDLERAFNRGNIHKHYFDMVQDPFGNCIPVPSPSLNNILDSVLSTNSEAGRHLGILVLYLFSTCATTAQDTPVGLLAQSNVGLEAILRATCMTHLAGVGLPLITLFLTVQGLYQMTEEQALRWLCYPELKQGIEKLIDLRRSQYYVTHPEDSSKRDTVKLFPYCRIVHQKYHQEMGHRGNEDLCYFMACLVDFKRPPEEGTGGAGSALWTKTLNPHYKAQISAAAKQVFSEKVNFTLTAVTPEQVEYKPGGKVGRKWISPSGGDEHSEGSADLNEMEVVDM